MSAGTPLTDADRLPWLQVIRATGIRECRAAWEKGEGRVHDKEVEEGKLGRPTCIIASSALKKYYRDILRGDAEVVWEDKVSNLELLGHVFCCASVYRSGSGR